MNVSHYIQCCFPFKLKRFRRRGDSNSRLLRKEDHLYSFEAQRLSEAIINGVIDDVQTLLLESTTIAINERDSLGFTPLSRAVQYGRYDIASLLLGLGANPNERNTDGTTPMHIAAQDGRDNIIQLLRSHASEIMASYTITIEHQRFEFTPMHFALMGKNLSSVQLLVELGVDIFAHLKSQSKGSFVPFIYLAAWLGFTDALDFLLASQQYGLVEALDVNRYMGRTVLMTLAEFGHIETIRYLLFDVMQDSDDRTILTNQKNSDWRDWTALHYASFEGHTDVVRTLVESGAMMNIVDTIGRTPLHYACSNCNVGALSVLVELGADTSKKDKGMEHPSDKPGSGKTPVELIPHTISNQRIIKCFKEAQNRYQQIKQQQRALKMQSAMTKTITKRTHDDYTSSNSASNNPSGSTTPTWSNTTNSNVLENGAYFINRLKQLQQQQANINTEAEKLL
jgi:ankyrin repeat protein